MVVVVNSNLNKLLTRSRKSPTDKNAYKLPRFQRRWSDPSRRRLHSQPHGRQANPPNAPLDPSPAISHFPLSKTLLSSRHFSWDFCSFHWPSQVHPLLLFFFHMDRFLFVPATVLWQFLPFSAPTSSSRWSSKCATMNSTNMGLSIMLYMPAIVSTVILV